jgi:ATPase subunit of ABC transporter with duplicated ATPase domains
VIDEVATRIWHFEAGRIEDFKGPYQEYLALLQERADKELKNRKPVAAGKGSSR